MRIKSGLSSSLARTATTTADTSTNNNGGTLVDGPTFTITVPASLGTGQALAFDGIDDYVAISEAAALNVTTDFTLAFWVKANTMSQSQLYLLNQNTVRYRFCKMNMDL